MAKAASLQDYFSGMLKYVIIIINSLVYFLYGFFNGDNGITVTSTIPATLKAGQEVAIELKVTKGQMNGFAKLQMDLPEGIAAKEVESRSANYTYNDGIAKWVWASLPPESEIVIRVVLVSDPAATLGAKTIRAKFSFVENNAKQVVEMTPAEITITAAGEPEAVATTAPVSTEKPQEEKPEEKQPAATGNSEPTGNVSMSRTIVKNSNEEYSVYIRIKKGATKGFARFSDDLPENVTVKAVKTEGASFSVGDGKLKFVWVNVPEKEELNLEYTVSGTSSEAVTLRGEYSYLEENQSKKTELTPESITLPTVSQVAATPKQEETPVAKNEEPVKTETSTTEKLVAEPVKTEPDTQEKMKESLAKKSGNVNYYVQVGAFTNAAVTAERLKKKFGISESVRSEMQGGFSKFMVGNHEEYKGARDHREKVKNNNGVKSAFVVAYNGGNRITVQEALMITSQKWFK